MDISNWHFYCVIVYCSQKLSHIKVDQVWLKASGFLVADTCIGYSEQREQLSHHVKLQVYCFK